MKIKGATTVLKKEAEFLGLSFEATLDFINRSPLAVSQRVAEAYKVYKEYNA